MQIKSTINRINELPRQVFMILILFVLGANLQAQTYVNGNLSTGATTQSGVAAPAGTTWSEVQNDAGVTTVSNTISGVGSSIAGNLSLADDFTIPPGSSWDITKLTFYAYQTGAPATPTPFNELRVQIHNSNPSAGPTTILFGDLTTNRLSASNDALIYRCFNTTTPAPGTVPGTTRKVWTLEANVTLNLPPGTYWIEWQTGVTTGTHFSPPSTIAGARTAPGYNAIQHDIVGATWTPLKDGGNPATLLDSVNLDMPFKIDYTASGCFGTPAPGNTLSTASSVCAGTPFTLSVANATSGSGVTYQWQSATAIGGPYTNIAGATSDTYTGTQTTATFYQLVVTCSASPGTSTPIQVGIIASPTITASPVSTTICSGANTSFTATATGASLNYQWQVSTDGGTTFTDILNGGIYGGATTNTLSLTNVPFANNGYQYKVVVSVTGCGSVNSSAATLTVNEAATITAQPANVTACAGNDATFTVTATGGAPLSYQWQVSIDGGITFSAIPGQNSATLVILALTPAQNNYQFNVIISNACTPAGITSTNAILTVSNVATITTQPVNVTVCEGLNAAFSATASGTSYQWQVSTDAGVTFTDIIGQTTASLSLTAVTASMNGNQYRLVVFSCGPTGLNSTAAVLTVNNAVSISTQPANVTACVGNDANFTITTATSTTTVTYQWEVSTDGGATYAPIAGATTSALTVSAVTAAMDGNLYHVIVSNGCTTSLISNAATLTTASLPVINTAPADVSSCENDNAIFSVTATGNALTYQWQVSTDGGTTFTDISGQTAATLTLTAVSPSMNANQYQAIVFSSCSATGTPSAAATLTVNALPTVVISAAPYSSLTSQLTTTLTATSTPASSVFSWFKDGVLIPASTGSTITVTHDDLGVYTASVTDANTCTNISNSLTISDSTASNSFVYPNPNAGTFNLLFDLSTGITNKVNVAAYDSKGARVYQKQFNIVSAIQTIPIDMSALAKGVYVLEVTDAGGARIRTEKIVIY